MDTAGEAKSRVTASRVMGTEARDMLLTEFAPGRMLAEAIARPPNTVPPPVYRGFIPHLHPRLGLCSCIPL